MATMPKVPICYRVELLSFVRCSADIFYNVEEFSGMLMPLISIWLISTSAGFIVADLLPTIIVFCEPFVSRLPSLSVVVCTIEADFTPYGKGSISDLIPLLISSTYLVLATLFALTLPYCMFVRVTVPSLPETIFSAMTSF